MLHTGAANRQSRHVDRMRRLLALGVNIAPALILLVFLAGAYFINPTTSSWTPSCPFHRLTGIYCPGCGTTRGLHRLSHGDLPGAMRMNILMVFAIPFVFWASLSQTWHTARGQMNKSPIYSHRLGMAITIIITAYWILRNIPLWPFTLLAPH